MIILLLMIASVATQASSKPTSARDVSGTWRDNRRVQTWTISQKDTEVTITAPRGSPIIGTLDGYVIKYTDMTVLTDASSKACEQYVGQTFEFPAKFKISKDGNTMERKTPSSVTKGQCKLDITKLPVIILRRDSSK
jgi:hypothetical protein